MSNTRELTLTAADGSRLFVRDSFVLDPAKLKGAIVIMHGLGEHCGRYSHVTRFFNDCGFSVRSYDHRGHGKSDGKRGTIPEGDPILQDAQIVIDDFAAQFKEPPLLLGHSMGGLFATRFALAQMSPLRGLILSSPALSVPLSGIQKILLAFLRKFAPTFTIPNGLQVDRLSHDPAVAVAYRQDPYVHNQISARLLLRMLDAIDFCEKNAVKLTIPALLIVAGDDQLVDPSGSRLFYKNAPPQLTTFKLYDGLYHELFNERDAAQIFGDVRQWLVQTKLI